MPVFVERAQEDRVAEGVPAMQVEELAMTKRAQTGWWNPSPFSMRRRATFHYVTSSGRTLCGKWMYMGEGLVEEGRDDHFENCLDCGRRKARLDSVTAKRKNQQ